MKRTMLIGALILVLATATFAAAGPYGGKRGGAFGPGPYGAVNLELTAEQAEKLAELRRSNFAEMQEIRNQLFQKRAELRLAWMQLEPDPARIRSIQKEINELRAQRQDKMVDHRMAFRNILTPEQLSKHLAAGCWNRPGKGRSGIMNKGFRRGGMARGVGPGACYGPGAWATPAAVR